MTITDTVGFIQKLPHGLVDAFKSTLSEVLGADLILKVVDASDEDYELIVEIPWAIKMNQSPRNAKNKPDNQYKRPDANAQAYLGFMRKLHHSSPSLAIGPAVVAVATPASTAAEASCT